MVKRTAAFFVLGLLAAHVRADDLVTTFNSYYNGTVLLVQQGGAWTLNVAQSSDYASGKLNILDIKNAFIQFDLIIKPEDVGQDGVDTEAITFATYPRTGKGDLVAECRNTSWFNLSVLSSGKWESVTDDVLPKDVFLKFFDQDYICQAPR